MSGKRGRPRTFPGKMTVTIGVRVPPEMADEMYLLAHRHSFDFSAETRAFWQRVLAKRRILLSENRQPSKDDALLTV